MTLAVRNVVRSGLLRPLPVTVVVHKVTVEESMLLRGSGEMFEIE
jgi:hypothetical protein